VTRADAIKYLIGHGIFRTEVLEALDITSEEVFAARQSIKDDRQRKYDERMSPDWRGEEMGG
jgi:hypothetical protein